jgi:hypothetical protein
MGKGKGRVNWKREVPSHSEGAARGEGQGKGTRNHLQWEQLRGKGRRHPLTLSALPKGSAAP